MYSGFRANMSSLSSQRLGQILAVRNPYLLERVGSEGKGSGQPGVGSRRCRPEQWLPANLPFAVKTTKHPKTHTHQCLTPRALIFFQKWYIVCLDWFVGSAPLSSRSVPTRELFPSCIPRTNHKTFNARRGEPWCAPPVWPNCEICSAEIRASDRPQHPTALQQPCSPADPSPCQTPRPPWRIRFFASRRGAQRVPKIWWACLVWFRGSGTPQASHSPGAHQPPSPIPASQQGATSPESALERRRGGYRVWQIQLSPWISRLHRTPSFAQFRNRSKTAQPLSRAGI